MTKKTFKRFAGHATSGSAGAKRGSGNILFPSMARFIIEYIGFNRGLY